MHSNNDAGFTVRVNRQMRDDATAALRERGIENRAIMEAVFTAIHDDFEGLLRYLDAHWPPEKPRGRPRKTDQETP